MWHTASLEDFLVNGPAPDEVHYLLCMEEADGDVLSVLGAVRDTVQGAVDALGRSEYAHRLGQLHFASQACSDISPAMEAIVAEWPPLFRANRRIQATQGSSKLSISRLDCQAFWCNPFIPHGVIGSLALVQDGEQLCNGRSATWRNHWLLVANTSASPSCNYGRMLDNAKFNSALGVIVYADVEAIAREMGASHADGWPPQNVHGTMVSHADGVALAAMAAAGATSVKFTTASDADGGLLLGASADGALSEAGFAMFARLASVRWLAERLVHASGQLGRLAPISPAHVTAVFDGAVLTPSASVRLDASAGALEGQGMPANPSEFNMLELALELSPADSAWEADAPVWDRLLRMHVCCDDLNGTAPPCAAECVTTWRRALRGSAAGGGGACGFELGRWVTPYKRAGSWVSDVSALLPLFASPACHFTIAVGGNDLGWKVSASLRWFRGYSAELARSVTAAGAIRQPSALQARRSTAAAGEEVGHVGVVPSRPRQPPATAARQPPLAAPRCTPHLVDAALGGGAVGSARMHASSGCAPDENPAAFSVAAHPTQSGRWVPEPLQRARHVLEDADVGGWWRPAQELHHDPYPTTAAEFLAAESEALGGRPLRPYRVVPLWPGGTFNVHYNDNQGAVRFGTPAGYRALETHAAALVATITGHGMDGSACGEFCPVSHHFSVNGWGEKVASYASAGTMWGCASGSSGFDGIPYGQVPNQYGTWFYGRHGWCPGQHVQPLLWDVSYDLAPAGEQNELRYDARLYGQPYTSRGSGAEIVLSAFLVLYTNEEQ